MKKKKVNCFKLHTYKFGPVNHFIYTEDRSIEFVLLKTYSILSILNVVKERSVIQHGLRGGFLMNFMQDGFHDTKI